MRGNTSAIILALAIVLAALSLMMEDNFSKLTSLRESLAVQRSRNQAQRSYNEEAKQDVSRLRNDSRAVEKAARNELGMARPNEMIFFFGSDTKTSEPKSAEALDAKR